MAPLSCPAQDVSLPPSMLVSFRRKVKKCHIWWESASWFASQHIRQPQGNDLFCVCFCLCVCLHGLHCNTEWENWATRVLYLFCFTSSQNSIARNLWT